MKKKILFILPSLNVGGLERMQITIANKLAECGHSVTVMTFEDGDVLAREFLPQVRFIKKPPKSFPVMSRVPYFWIYYDFSNWAKRASAKQLYKYYIGDEKYDVEIAFFRGLAVKIISGSSNKNSTKLAWVHNDFKLCADISGGFKSMEDVKSAYKKFDKIVSVSNKARESFEEIIGLKNTVTVYNMLLSKQIRKKAEEKIDLQKEKFTVISVGRLTEQKSFIRLLEAVSKLRNHDFDLWIVGEGEDRPMLESFIKENNLTNVKLLGNQSNPYKYISKADLLICSSKYEGFNLTVGEALVLGVPVMSTDCTGPTEILDNGKYGLIVENSVEGITDGLNKLISDNELYNHYKEVASQRTDFFDEDKIVKQIEDLF